MSTRAPVTGVAEGMSAQVPLGHPSAGCPVLEAVGDQAPIIRLGRKITALG